MFEVILSPEAADFFAAADRPLARKLARCFTQLETEPVDTTTLSDCLVSLRACCDTEWEIGESCTALMIPRIVSWSFRLHTAEKSTIDGVAKGWEEASTKPVLRA